jgi:hypothetical protein
VAGPGDRRRTIFDGRIGTFHVTCVVEHEPGAPTAAGGAYAAAADLLGDPALRYHGDAFKARSQHVEDVALDLRHARVAASVTIIDGGAGRRPDQGFGAKYQPSVSMIDAVVGLAQMAQALIYALDGIERADSNTFWMRGLALQRETPVEPLGLALPGSLQVTRTRHTRRGSADWGKRELEGRLAGIRVQTTVAHQLPAGPYPRRQTRSETDQ